MPIALTDSASSSRDLGRASVAVRHALDRLTAFADNLVPHVLRVDGILDLDPI